MPESMRNRLGLGAALLLLVGLLARGLAAWITFHDLPTVSPVDQLSESGSVVASTVLASLGTFLLATGVVFVAGAVATMVLGEQSKDEFGGESDAA